MCFSAGASFSSAAFLTVVGFLSFKQAPTRMKFFAMIPLFFALQQATEGLIWLLNVGIQSNTKSPLAIPFIMIAKPITTLVSKITFQRYYAFLQESATFIYLTFALVLWPTWVPFSLSIAETSALRRNILLVLLAIGLGISGMLLTILLIGGVNVQVIKGNLIYTVPEIFHKVQITDLLLYCLVTILPFFITSMKGTKILGLALTGSAVLTWYAWYTTFGSMWCFFAALLSVGILTIVHNKPNHTTHTSHT